MCQKSYESRGIKRYLTVLKQVFHIKYNLRGRKGEIFPSVIQHYHANTIK